MIWLISQLVYLLWRKRQVYNLLPGQGLGRETSNRLAYGLGSWVLLETLVREIINLVSRITMRFSRESRIDQ